MRSAAVAIVEAIASGQYEPGQRLVETRLARSLGISRSPLREALKALESEGLVRIEKDRGTFVREVPPVDVEHMISLRASLEGLAARLFIASGNLASLRDLEACNAAMRLASESGNAKALREADWRFHELICYGSGNPFLLRAWRNIFNLLRLYVIHLNTSYDLDEKQVLRHHEAFLKALNAGHADRAAELLCSTIIVTGFRTLRKPVPRSLRGLVTVTVDAASNVVPIGPLPENECTYDVS